MKKMKAVTYRMAAVVFVLVLSACSGSGEEESAEAGGESGDKTVEFMHLWPEGSSAQHYKIVNDIITDFEEENEGVTVDVEVLSNEQYKDKIKVLSTSNELPDVGMTWAAGYLEPYVSGEKFAPLDDILEDGLQEEFVEGTTDAYAIDGQTYGLPLELNTVNVYYNKNIFEEHDLEVPKTLEEFNAVVDTLNENDVAPVALGNADSWTGSMWYMYLADRIGGSELLTQAIEEGDFNQPELIQAAEEVQNLVNNNTFMKGANGLSDEEAKSSFMNNQAAMYMIATWDLPNFTTNEDVPQEFRDSVGYFKFPTVDGSGDMNSYVGGPGVGMFVAENSDVKEEAKAFTKFFVEEWGEKAVTEVGVLPATKVDAGKLDLEPLYVDVLNDLNEASNITLYADVQMSAEAADVHLKQVQALFGGEITPEEFTEAHTKALSN